MVDKALKLRHWINSLDKDGLKKLNDHLGKKILGMGGELWLATIGQNPENMTIRDEVRERLKWVQQERMLRRRAIEKSTVRTKLQRKLLPECNYILKHDKNLISLLKREILGKNPGKKILFHQSDPIFVVPCNTGMCKDIPWVASTLRGDEIAWIAVSILWILKHHDKPLLGSRRFALVQAIKGERLNG